jgi:hypothetical protein
VSFGDALMACLLADGGQEGHGWLATRLCRRFGHREQYPTPLQGGWLMVRSCTRCQKVWPAPRLTGPPPPFGGLPPAVRAQ